MQTPKQKSDETEPVLALRLVRGVHAGAERRCGSGDVVVIGGGDDCDLILADDAVQPHHCIVSVIGTDIGVRAVEAAVRAGGRVVAPGEPVRIALFEVVEIGAAAFALGPVSNDEEWTRVREAMSTAANDVAAGEATKSAPPRSRKRLVIGAAVAVAAVVTGAISAPLLRPSAPTLATRQAMAEQIVKASDLPEVRVGGDNGRVRVSGVVPDPTRAEKLREDLGRNSPGAEIDLRSGSSIAHDVVDVLRLSGIPAEGRYTSDGQVEVRGHFGDQAKLQKVVESRVMREVGGLKRVVTLNLDVPPAPPSKPADDSKLIAEVVAGNDPYIVTRDGSRYYVGAKLPGGGTLQAIDGQDVVVDTGKAVKHLARTDSINNG